MTPNHSPRARSLRRVAAVAGIALGAGTPALVLAGMTAGEPDTTPDSSQPATGSESGFETNDVEADDIAEAKAGLSMFLSEHGSDVGDAAVFLPPETGCPVMPAENLAWFANQIGLEADPLAAFASIDLAERAAPDLVPGAAAGEATQTTDTAVASTPASGSDPSTSLAGTTDVVGAPILVATCGFGVPSGGVAEDAAAAPTSTSVADPAAAPDSTSGTPDSAAAGSAPATDGLVPAEGMLLRAAVFDDSTFADALTEKYPDAEVVSPTADGLDGEIVGHCAAATGRGADMCTVWWHQDGLAIGVELTGSMATFDSGAETISAMVPAAVEVLGAIASGETPQIPPPPTAAPTSPPETTPPMEQIEFPEGEDATTVEGSIERGDYASYAFRAEGGQTVEMTISATENNATFNLYAPDGTQLASNETSFAGAAPAGGNYAVEVGATEGTADYALTLTITGEPTEPPSTPPSSDPPDGPGGGTIEFPSGEDSATVEGDLGEGVVDTWTLQAAAGQSMEVLVYTDERNALFSIYAPNGDRLAENVPTWTGDLPADGGYVIEVTSTGGEAVYELAVVIT